MTNKFCDLCNKSTPEEKLKEWGINKEFLLCPTCYKKKMKHVKQ
jgi:NAD-dependent SIR2 family protein deacetylase